MRLHDRLHRLELALRCATPEDPRLLKAWGEVLGEEDAGAFLRNCRASGQSPTWLSFVLLAGLAEET